LKTKDYLANQVKALL